VNQLVCEKNNQSVRTLDNKSSTQCNKQRVCQSVSQTMYVSQPISKSESYAISLSLL